MERVQISFRYVSVKDQHKMKWKWTSGYYEILEICIYAF